MAEEKMAKEKLAKEKLAKEKLAKEKLAKEKLSRKEKIGQGKNWPRKIYPKFAKFVQIKSKSCKSKFDQVNCCQGKY